MAKRIWYSEKAKERKDAKKRIKFNEYRMKRLEIEIELLKKVQEELRGKFTQIQYRAVYAIKNK